VRERERERDLWRSMPLCINKKYAIMKFLTAGLTYVPEHSLEIYATSSISTGIS
jgi:hypothetical protein